MGCARHDGVSVELRRAPVIEGLECMTEMDFIPGVMAEIRIGCEAKRDMLVDEKARVMALLIQMSSEARDALEGESTIFVGLK
jgi:hypothetical protein